MNTPAWSLSDSCLRVSVTPEATDDPCAALIGVPAVDSQVWPGSAPIAYQTSPNSKRDGEDEDLDEEDEDWDDEDEDDDWDEDDEDDEDWDDEDEDDEDWDDEDEDDEDWEDEEDE